MSLLVKDPISGKIYDAHKVQMADALLAKAKKMGTWATIDYIISRWQVLNPEYAKEAMDYTAAMRAVQKNEFGSTGLSKTGNIKGMGLRATLSIDAGLKRAIEIFCIRAIKEHKGGEKGFWREFCRRYPAFSLAQKI